MRKLFVSVCAVLAAALSFPALAAADDFELFLDDGRLQLNSGADDEVDVLAPARASATLSGEIDDAGAVTVPEDPQQRLFDGFKLDDGTRVQIGAAGDLSGSFDEATGDLSLDPDLALGIIFQLRTSDDGTPVGCIGFIGGGVSTAGSSPDGEFAADPFASGLVGSGSVIASWQELSNLIASSGATEAECDAVEEAYGGPGAVELGFPVGPQLTTKVTPRRNEIKPGGRAATYRLNVSTIDSDEPAGVKVCGQLRKGISIVGGNCVRAAGVGPEGKTVPVKIKATRKAKPGLYDDLALLADAPGYSGGASRIEVKVARR